MKNQMSLGHQIGLAVGLCALHLSSVFGQVTTAVSDVPPPTNPIASIGSGSFPPVRLTFNPSSSITPKAAVDAANLYVVWEDGRDGNREIYFQRFGKDGNPRTAPVRVSNTPQNSVDPAVGIDGARNSYIVWQEDTPWGTIYAAKVDSSGHIVVNPMPVSSNLSLTPEIDVASNGNNTIVYHRLAPTDQDVYVRHGNAGLAQICLRRFNDGTLPGFNKTPAVAIADNGTAIVSWYDMDQLWNTGVYIGGAAFPGCQVTDFRRHADGIYEDIDLGYSGSFPWLVCEGSGNVFNLHGTHGKTPVNDVAGTARYPRVGDDPSYAYVVWQDERDGNWEIYLSLAYSTNSYGDVRLTEHQLTSSHPDIATYTPNPGEWWVVWQDNRDGNYEIYMTTNTHITLPVCGDADGDGTINIGDVVYWLNWMFKGVPAPNDVCRGDYNCDGRTNIGDVVHLIKYIFQNGPAPCAT
jgi:hypothetical protein